MTRFHGQFRLVHRAYVDYVVIEQDIAHPDFRTDLRKEAARVYNV